MCTNLVHAVLVLPPELLGDVLLGVVPGERLVAEHLERSVGQRLLQHLLLGRRVSARVLGGGSGALMMLRAQRVMHSCRTGVCLQLVFFQRICDKWRKIGMILLAT